MAYDEKKWAEFNKLLQDNKNSELVVVHDPTVIGDNYGEIIENLNRLADAGLALKIGKPFRN